MGDIEDLKKRVKELLKEPDNLRCSECRSKKNKPKYFSLLKTPERGQLGVFCCKGCHEFHVALGSDYATVKSLKHPEECELNIGNRGAFSCCTIWSVHTELIAIVHNSPRFLILFQGQNKML